MWGSIIGGVLGGILGNKSSSKAANAQVAGMQQGADAIKGYYNDAKGYMSPYMDLGQQGNSRLMGLLQDPNSIADSAAYKWRFDQGMNMRDNSAASRGMLFSGAHQKDLMNYGQGLASQEYDNEWNRLAGLSGMGLNAASGLSEMGMGAGNSLARLYSGMGDARASSYAAKGQNNSNIIGSLLGGLFG